MTTDASLTRVDGSAEPESAPQRRAPDPYDDIGTTLGRYVVVERVGSGGMGTVVRAYDPRLHREVALKRVHRGAIGRDAADRMIREAQAMAQLNHPNVVAVYDVETIDDSVVIAMEYVAGSTLDVWCQVRPRTWREVVGAYVDAGRGLHAAHLAGLVHRDFKPTNVLVSTTGIVKVMDFGLAKPLANAEPSESAMLAFMAGSDEGVGLDRTLTRGDTVVGTPRYMAPEQHTGEDAGPTADQYAFCVSLWEAVTGRKLFALDSIDAIARAKLRGPGEWPGRSGVPTKLGEVLTRGLAPDRTSRWPDMATLLGQLTAIAMPATRGRWLGIAAIGVAAGATAVLAMRGSGDVCGEAGDKLSGSWNDARRDALGGAFARGGDPASDETTTRVVAAIEVYADDWRAAIRDACESHHVRHEQSDRVLDLRTTCLERRRQGLDAAIDRLVDDPGVLATAIDQVYALDAVHGCAEVEALQADVPPPGDPELAREVVALRGRIAQASAVLTAGDHAGALLLADAIEEEPAAIEYTPVRLEAAIVGADAMSRLGRWSEAATKGRATLATALEIGAADIATRAATMLATTVGSRMQRPIEGRIHAEVALALARRRDPEGLLEIRATSVFAAVLGVAASFDESEALARHALAIAVRELGPDHVETARAHTVLGTTLTRLSRFAEAETELRRAIAITEATLGPDHPETSFGRQSLAHALGFLGRLDETEAEQQHILASRIRAFGERHPDTAAARALLGTTWRDQGRTDEAIAAQRAALQTLREELGPDATPTAQQEGNLAISLLEAGKLDEAQALFDHAQHALARTLGQGHPDVASTIFNLGKTLARRGRFADAEREYRRAIQILLGALPEHHRDIAAARLNLADVIEEQGRHGDAEIEMRASIDAFVHTHGEDHMNVAGSRLNLASLLQAQGKLDEAEAAFRAAIGVFESKVDPRNPNLAVALMRFGDLLRERGKLDEGLPLLERAVALIDASGARPAVRGELHFELGRALVLRPESRARGVEQARLAAALLDGTTENPDTLAALAAFLQTHDPAARE